MPRLFVSIAASVLLVAPARPADAWGFEAHKYIMGRTIPLLPAEIRPFFEKFQAEIAEHAIDPDLWRTAGWLEEPPRHFLDMDAYGPYPFKQLPREYDEAVRRYGRDFVEKNGTLPWRTDEIYRKLVEAFTLKAPYARDNVKFFSSVLGHYVGDAHVPFHAALNYDGQLTGQWGIHSRFETELFLRYQSRLKITPGPVVKVGNVRDFIFDSLLASFPLVQPILDADKAAVAGREVYDDGYFEMLLAKVQPILERRLADSITDTASLITGAWIEAGRLALPLEESRVPRKVRR
jgi:hypothetical protein